ncbi:hypothetical protein MXD61_04475 [Frankia sp. AgPm24]|uniref:Uncharacterized protein n=1 Tax=Frankia umida TaxID=573489 RepID=A0ABT0K520_9ACTN|nr:MULTISPECIES: hypothetical protein [Frankia]MCK9878896.1 hypothetical protein [Frankia umida]MCK9921168.1 hypothetical protein [Frankia sp. AgPm24]
MHIGSRWTGALVRRGLRSIGRELGRIAATTAFVEAGAWPAAPADPSAITPADPATAPSTTDRPSAPLDRMPSQAPMSCVERDLWRQLSDLTVLPSEDS